VQVCPTGIDIRDGLQYECIACAACIDACDSIMDKMDYPRGLVRYTTQHALEGKETRVLRPRTIVYATLLTVLFAGMLLSMFTRTPLILDVIRDRNALYRELADGSVENAYTLKVINQSNAARQFELSVTGAEGLELEGVSNPVSVDGGGVLNLPVRARLTRDGAYGMMDISFTATATDDPNVVVVENSRFIGPSR
jgi:cytochrome c oxidase accessory protein FixG